MNSTNEMSSDVRTTYRSGSKGLHVLIIASVAAIAGIFVLPMATGGGSYLTAFQDSPDEAMGMVVPVLVLMALAGLALWTRRRGLVVLTGIAAIIVALIEAGNGMLLNAVGSSASAYGVSVGLAGTVLLGAAAVTFVFAIVAMATNRKIPVSPAATA